LQFLGLLMIGVTMARTRRDIIDDSSLEVDSVEEPDDEIEIRMPFEDSQVDEQRFGYYGRPYGRPYVAAGIGVYGGIYGAGYGRPNYGRPWY
jgi:hypothetical protein